MRFTIQVLNENGKPVAGKRVTVIFTSFLRGSLDDYTNDDGLAVFDYEVNPGEIGIYVNGDKQATDYAEDGEVFTVNI